jgi:hypothetical protein
VKGIVCFDEYVCLASVLDYSVVAGGEPIHLLLYLRLSLYGEGEANMSSLLKLGPEGWISPRQSVVLKGRRHSGLPSLGGFRLVGVVKRVLSRLSLLHNSLSRLIHLVLP